MFNTFESKWFKSTMLFLSILLVCVSSVGFLTEIEVVNKDTKRIWQDLMELKRDESLSRKTSMRERIEKDGVTLEAWYCTGPFKDEFKGIHFRSFNYVFRPEREVLAAGQNLTDLSQAWEVKKYPGMVESRRQWEKRVG